MASEYVLRRGGGDREQVLCNGRWRSAHKIENEDAADVWPSHGAAFNALMRRGEYGAARIAWRRVIVRVEG